MVESQQPNLIALISILVALSTIAVLLRLWGVWIQPNRKFGWDDACALAALPFVMAENAGILWYVALGLGLHAVDVPASNLAQIPKVIFMTSFFNDAAIGLPKFSALFFYHRIFETTNMWFHRALWTVGGIQAAWLVAAWLSTLFQCTPVHKAWDPTTPGHCFPQWNWYLGIALASTAIDLCILIMPLPLLWRLQMSTPRKFLITGVFLCGYAVVVVSVGRVIALAEAGTGFEDDITWSTINYVEWVQCEGPISLISVCLPSIFQLAKGARKFGFSYLLTGRPSKSSQSNLVLDNNNSKSVVNHQLHKFNGKSGSFVYQHGNGEHTETHAWSNLRNKSATESVSTDERPSLHSRDDRIYVRSQIDVESAV